MLNRGPAYHYGDEDIILCVLSEEFLCRFAYTVIRHVEAAELDGFAQPEHILGLARAKAQLILARRS